MKLGSFRRGLGMLAMPVLLVVAGCNGSSSTGSGTPSPLSQELTFTGKLIGTMKSAGSGSTCGPTGSGYSASWKGNVTGLNGKSESGSPWTVSFDITNYHGAGSYSIVGNISGHASLTTAAGQQTYALIFGTFVIGSDQKSGSMTNVQLSQVGQSSVAAAVLANGSWSCG